MDVAEGRNLLEIVVTLLVRVHREYQVAFAERLVLLDEPHGDFQQRHVHRNLRLGALGDDPPFSVGLLDKVFCGEGFHIDVSQSGVAAEEKDVPHALKPL